MNKKYIYQLGVVVFITLTAFSCEHDYPPQNRIEVLDDYNISVTPEKTEYAIGDTIWLSAEISEEDMLSGTGFDGLTGGVGFFGLQIFKLKKAYVYFDEGAANFDLMYSNGDIQEYDSTKYGSDIRSKIIRDTEMDYQNKTYSIQIGLIPKVQGEYSFYIQSAWVFYDKMPDASYEFRYVNQHFTVNSNHIKILEDLGYSDKIFIGNSINNYSLPLDDSTRIFAFIVK